MHVSKVCARRGGQTFNKQVSTRRVGQCGVIVPGQWQRKVRARMTKALTWGRGAGDREVLGTAGERPVLTTLHTVPGTHTQQYVWGGYTTAKQSLGERPALTRNHDDCAALAPLAMFLYRAPEKRNVTPVSAVSALTVPS